MRKLPPKARLDHSHPCETHHLHFVSWLRIKLGKGQLGASFIQNQVGLLHLVASSKYGEEKRKGGAAE